MGSTSGLSWGEGSNAKTRLTDLTAWHLLQDDLGHAGTLDGEAFSERSNMYTHAEVMAKTLAEGGVKYVFGLPGGEIAAFIESCRRADIRFLLTGHESGAALMA